MATHYAEHAIVLEILIFHVTSFRFVFVGSALMRMTSRNLFILFAAAAAVAALKHTELCEFSFEYIQNERRLENVTSAIIVYDGDSSILIICISLEDCLKDSRLCNIAREFA
jgi:uncharacterized membrane protein required for colicin V production